VIWGNRSIAVSEGETILGRALDATIRFDVPGVSRRHARLSVEGATITVEDLHSQNGTYVGGKQISGRAPISDGDEVRLGPVSIVIRLVSPDGSTLPM
jgi:pSer/pThr/pTyr-binding forkhead associated (FHA) protein